MGNPLLQRNKVALDALLEGFADPARASADYHIDPDYSKPMGQKGTEPEDVHYGSDPDLIGKIWKYFRTHRVGKVEEIAAFTGLSPEQVQPALQEMGDMGFLRSHRTGEWQMLVGGGKIGKKAARPEGGYDVHCRECGKPIEKYEEMMYKDCLAGTDYHSIGSEEMGLLLDDWMESGTLAKQGDGFDLYVNPNQGKFPSGSRVEYYPGNPTAQVYSMIQRGDHMVIDQELGQIPRADLEGMKRRKELKFERRDVNHGSSVYIYKLAGGKMCTCGCPMSGHTKPPDFGCPNEPGCGCKGATEVKTALNKKSDPRIEKYMMEYVQADQNETFPQFVARRSQEDAAPKAMGHHAGTDDKEAEAPLPGGKHDPIEPSLNPEDKIFKRSLEAVLAAAGGRSFMFNNFRFADDAASHLIETVKTGSARADFRTIWAWAEHYFPKKSVGTKQSGFKQAQDISPLGTKQSGFTGGGPFHCGNCIHKVMAGETAVCKHPEVMSDPELVHLKQADGTIKVDANDCCNFVRPPKKENEEKTSAVEQKLTPQVLPQRDDMRGHLDEDVKDEIARMVNKPKQEGAKGVHIGADKRYPDSQDGAVACLKEMSTLKTKGATARPDPSVQGVWLVTLPAEGGRRAVVYLGGYRDPMGQVRPNNDFEVEDEKTSAMTDDSGATTGLRRRPDYGESKTYTNKANEMAITGDLGDAQRIDEDAQSEYFMDQVQDAKREAYQSFLQDEWMQQEAQDNGWTMEELWGQVGEDYTNEYWQPRTASSKKDAVKS